MKIFTIDIRPGPANTWACFDGAELITIAGDPANAVAIRITDIGLAASDDVLILKHRGVSVAIENIFRAARRPAVARFEPQLPQ